MPVEASKNAPEQTEHARLLSRAASLIQRINGFVGERVADAVHPRRRDTISVSTDVAGTLRRLSAVKRETRRRWDRAGVRGDEVDAIGLALQRLVRAAENLARPDGVERLQARVDRDGDDLVWCRHLAEIVDCLSFMP